MDDEEKLVCRNTVLRKKFFHTISEKMIYGWSESNTKWFFSILFDMLDVQKTRDAWLRNIVLPACVWVCVRVFLISFTLKHGISCAIDKSILTKLLLCVCVCVMCVLPEIPVNL